MGIDYGSKKIGIALSDDSGVMAFPHEVVPNDGQFLSYIEQTVVDNGVEEIVIGHSLNNNGEPNEIHATVETFIIDVTLQIGIPVHLEPEQYSSQQAAQVQGKNNQIDASAAAIILNNFITKQK
jgi:putative Holliday junction resolvase